MFTDMVGYTALGQRNESLSLALVDEQRKLIRPILSRHNGREIKTIGDAFLVEFPNALDAVRCAYDIQRATREFNISIPEEKRIHLRVGLHLGDVVESQGDISGDAVNVASRIEPLAEDGGVCLTRQVYESTHNKLEVPLVSMGMKPLKNVSEPMEVYRIQMPWEQTDTSKETITLPRNRIAILPFRNMSPDPNDEYFAEGMTEEIISTVSGISGLKVISRTSVMGYKGTAKKVKEIGKELEVGSVLEGSFRKAGNKIRVTTQLIDVAGDEHLWAQNYDRELDDVFEVQSDVAKQVAQALQVKILSPEKERIDKKPTGSTAAYTLHLKGRYLWNKRGMDDLKMARECFEQAVRMDPLFALGYAGVADCCLILRNNWGVDIEENLSSAKAALAKALGLDPDLAEAHATMGLLLEQEYKTDEAEKELIKAIELKPSYATAHQWYSGLLGSRLKWEEACEQIEKALELDPLSPIINHSYGEFCFWSRDYRRAVEIFKRSAEVGSVYASLWMALSHARLGMHEDAMREYSEWMKVRQIPLSVPQEIEYEMTVAYFRGDRDTVRRLLPEFEKRYQDTGNSAYMVAEMYFFLGETDKGFEWVERSLSRGETGSLVIRCDPDLDGVRNDPRYLDLVKRLGLD
jgi:TolB-like protein/Tfp pilus assembly protein PilF